MGNATAGDAGYRCAALACYGFFCHAQGAGAWWYDHQGLGSYCSMYWKRFRPLPLFPSRSAALLLFGCCQLQSAFRV